MLEQSMQNLQANMPFLGNRPPLKSRDTDIHFIHLAGHCRIKEEGRLKLTDTEIWVAYLAGHNRSKQEGGASSPPAQASPGGWLVAGAVYLLSGCPEPGRRIPLAVVYSLPCRWGGGLLRYDHDDHCGPHHEARVLLPLQSGLQVGTARPAYQDTQLHRSCL